MSQKILGIDLGTSSVKVLLLERSVRDLNVLEYFNEPLNLQSRAPHAEQVSGILERLFSQNILEADVVSMSLPGHLLSSRVITLPFTNVKKIQQLIEFELESFIPFPIEETFNDFHILNQRDNESDVLCTYTQEDSFREYLDGLSDSGIEAKYFGADLTDLSGIAQVAMVPVSGYYAICDIGHSKTNLLIMEGKELRYARTIGIGGYHFTRAIQRAFNLNQEKAEALKLSRGKLFCRVEDSDQVSRTIHREAIDLVSAIKQTFLGARQLYKDLKISALYGCGGGTKLVGMIDFLSFHLRINAFELEVLNFINHNFDDAEDVNTFIPQVLAVAVRPIYSNRVPRINFRKGPYAFKQELQMITSEFKSIGMLLVMIMVLGVGYYFYADHIYAKKMAVIDDQIDTLVRKDFKELRSGGSKKRREKTSSLRTYLKAAKKKLEEFKASSPANSGDNVVEVMYAISASLPAKKDVNFEVQEFTFSNDFVRLKASTNDTLSVEKIVSALESSKRFAKVESTDAKPKPGNIWDFSLKLDFKKDE